MSTATIKKSAGFKKLCKKHDVDPNLIPEITSFEDSCKWKGIDPTILPIVEGLPIEHRKRIISDYKLTIIAEALRQGWVPDYTNTNQWKYYPVFVVKANVERASGFGLSYGGYGCWYTFSRVGVRLCFPNSDMAEYFAKQFIDLHTDHQLYT